jgi:hypothetical protein
VGKTFVFKDLRKVDMVNYLMKISELKRDKLFKLYTFDDRPVWTGGHTYHLTKKNPRMWHVHAFRHYFPTEESRIRSQNRIAAKLGYGVKWVLTEEEQEYMEVLFEKGDA